MLMGRARMSRHAGMLPVVVWIAMIAGGSGRSLIHGQSAADGGLDHRSTLPLLIHAWSSTFPRGRWVLRRV